MSPSSDNDEQPGPIPVQGRLTESCPKVDLLCVVVDLIPVDFVEYSMSGVDGPGVQVHESHIDGEKDVHGSARKEKLQTVPNGRLVEIIRQVSSRYRSRSSHLTKRQFAPVRSVFWSTQQY
jgi:methyl coenzyme M reductase subunit C